MMPSGVSHKLKRFVEEHIESVPQLEALLLLRSEPQREWTATEIAKELYIPEDVAQVIVSDFPHRGFADTLPSNQAIAYRDRDQDTARLIEQLKQTYQDRRVAIVSLIYSKPLNKV